jgi:hypothetical protein
VASFCRQSYVLLWAGLLKGLQLALWPRLRPALGDYAYPAAYPVSLRLFALATWYCGSLRSPVALALLVFAALGTWGLRRGDYLIEGGHDLGDVIVGGRVYNGTALPELAGRYVFGYWSDGFVPGDAILLVATPPPGWNATAFPDFAANLTPEDIGMWSVQRLNVTGPPAGEAFLLGFGEDEESELYALTTGVAGPDASTATGRVWKIVPAEAASGI